MEIDLRTVATLLGVTGTHAPLPTVEILALMLGLTAAEFAGLTARAQEGLCRAYAKARMGL